MSVHVCAPRIADYGEQQTTCMTCRERLVRIEHVPDHRIAGQPCGFPDRWRYCFIPEARHLAIASDPLLLADWRLA